MQPIYSRAMDVTLHGPGPSDVAPEVLKALATPTIGHLDAHFLTIMDETQHMLRQLFNTTSQMTIPVSGTGSSGMETLVANIIEPSDRVLVVQNGVFGGRIASEVERHGGVVDLIELPWGTTVTHEQLQEHFANNTYTALFLVHAETSTGALQPYMKEIGELAHEHNALFLVDAVTSLGGSPFLMDEWGVDGVYSGTQKCLGVPPGLAPVALNERAMAKVNSRQTPIRSWYFDLTLIANYWKGAKRSYHHTAPINSIFALHESLRLLTEEGIDARIKRHARNGAALAAGLKALGCNYIVQNEEERLPMLHAIYLPQGLSEATLRNELRTTYNIEVGGGLGEFAGKAWRIGLMGNSCTQEKVLTLLSVLGELFEKHDACEDPQCGVMAAHAVYDSY